MHYTNSSNRCFLFSAHDPAETTGAPTLFLLLPPLHVLLLLRGVIGHDRKLDQGRERVHEVDRQVEVSHFQVTHLNDRKDMFKISQPGTNSGDIFGDHSFGSVFFCF